jgi:hypothetical protein
MEGALAKVTDLGRNHEIFFKIKNKFDFSNTKMKLVR